ncbi:MAG: hypothetical protein ACLUNS_08255 [Alistipes shahii]
MPVLRAVLASPYYDEYERIGPSVRPRYGDAEPHRRSVPTISAIRSPRAPPGRSTGVQGRIRAAVHQQPRLLRCAETAARADRLLADAFGDDRAGTAEGASRSIPTRTSPSGATTATIFRRAWINAYDAGCVVREKSLYDLHAIPALYLLDSRQARAGEGFDRRGADRRDNRPPGVKRLIDGLYGRWMTRRLLSCSCAPRLKSRFWERTAGSHASCPVLRRGYKRSLSRHQKRQSETYTDFEPDLLSLHSQTEYNTHIKQ